MDRHEIIFDDDDSDDEMPEKSFCSKSRSFIAPISFCVIAFFIPFALYLSTWYGNYFFEFSVRQRHSPQFDASKVLAIMNNLTDYKSKQTESSAAKTNVTAELILHELKQMQSFGPNIFNYYTRNNASDCVEINKNKDGITLCYENVQYIVAEILTNNGEDERILLNCHFDTVPNNADAITNVISCATMLEIMDILLKDPTPLKKNVIFLFNEAEESNSLGIYSFLKQEVEIDKKKISAFINLDNWGLEGWQMLYQSSSIDLTKLYAESVLAPHGNVILEDLSQLGYLQSEPSDYTVFPKYGLHGINLVLYKNSYIHHTKQDTSKHLNQDSIQYAGDNALQLTRAYINESTLLGTSLKKALYFDIFKTFIIYTKESTAFVVGYVIAAASIFSILLISRIIDFDVIVLGKLITAILLTGLSYCLVGVTVYLISFAVCVFRINMLWYTSSWLIFYLYGVPSFVAMTLPYVLYTCLIPKRRQKRSEVALSILTVQFIWTVLSIFVIFMQIRSFYLISIALLPVTINNMFWGIISCSKKCVYYWMIIGQCVYMLCAAMYFTYVVVDLFDLVIPISGRSGPSVNSDLNVGILTAVFCVLVFSYYVPTVLLLRKPSQLIFIFFFLLTWTTILIFIKAKENPYTKDSPQQFHILNVERKSYHYQTEHSYTYPDYIIYPNDRRGINTLKTLFPERAVRSVEDTCAYNLYCSIPGPDQKYAYRVNAKQAPAVNRPALSHSLSPKITNKCKYHATVSESSDDSCNTLGDSSFNFRKIYFTYEGNADRVKFAISPYELIVMHSWSLTDKTPNKYTEWNDQKVYAFIYKRGLPDRQNNSFEFQITLQVPNNYYGKLVRVSVESEFISSITFTKDYEDTLNMFPEWTDVAAWNAFYEEMVVSVL